MPTRSSQWWTLAPFGAWAESWSVHPLQPVMTVTFLPGVFPSEEKPSQHLAARSRLRTGLSI